jgi:hypothetical protein
MLTRTSLLPAVIAFFIGAADWELARQLGGRREAWDGPLFWPLAYPLLLLAALLFGASAHGGGQYGSSPDKLSGLSLWLCRRTACPICFPWAS